MIDAIHGSAQALSHAQPELPVVPLSQRATDAIAASEDGALIEDMVKQFALQQFVQALLGGDPELTGIPDIAADGG